MQRGPEYTERDGELGSLLRLVFLDPATLESSVVRKQVAVIAPTVFTAKKSRHF